MFLRIESLCFSYGGKDRALVLDNYNLQLEAGATLGIAGPSGQGKSTLLRLIAGLERPSAGSIVINNQIVVDANTWAPPEDRRVGMVFQDYGLFPHMSLARNIAYGLHGHGSAHKKKQTKAMLELIHMGQLASRYPAQISGGQQQRVALARALAPEPQLLLLDEPFSNLDAHLKCSIRNELCEILAKTKTTCILVSHDMADLQAVCNAIAFIGVSNNH